MSCTAWLAFPTCFLVKVARQVNAKVFVIKCTQGRVPNRQTYLLSQYTTKHNLRVTNDSTQ